MQPLRGALAAIAMLAACAQAQPGQDSAGATSTLTVEARAAAALAPFKSGLMQALQSGLAESPESAIRVCRIEAPAIAERSGEPGLQVGRSSHRLRNPVNAPAPWMREIIDHYLASPDDRAPRTVRLAEDRYGYAEPIVTQPMCTVCHGRAIAPQLAGTIAELYPEDQATGFEAGELRGIFWVTLDATPHEDEGG